MVEAAGELYEIDLEENTHFFQIVYINLFP